MSGAELRLTWTPDYDWHGTLEGVVKSGAFRGRGCAWFDGIQLKETFIAALRAFPLSASDPPMMGDGDLRIAITPYDVRGTLLIEVYLATQSWTTQPNSTQANRAQQTVTARFLTEYAALDRFASHLEQVLDGNRNEAVLSGTVPH